MKRIITMAATLVLVGCGGKTDDLERYVSQVKARQVPFNSELPQIDPFIPQPYTAYTKRPPFTEVRPEAMMARRAQETRGECQQPPGRQETYPLEQYSLDNLTMKGTLGDNQGLWALVESQDGELFKVGVGSYLGLHNGKVIRISAQSVELEEWLPDNKGCWKVHQTQLVLAGQEQQSS